MRIIAVIIATINDAAYCDIGNIPILVKSISINPTVMLNKYSHYSINESKHSKRIYLTFKFMNHKFFCILHRSKCIS